MCRLDEIKKQREAIYHIAKNIKQKNFMFLVLVREKKKKLIVILIFWLILMMRSHI